MKFLLDTNVVSEPTKPHPDLGVLKHLEAHSGDLAIATVAWHELRFGVARLPKGKRRAYLRAYLEEVVLETMHVIPYDFRAADWHALERARLTSAGMSPSFADGQVAAIAATNDLVLVTRNTTDFARFAGLEVENWFT